MTTSTTLPLDGSPIDVIAPPGGMAWEIEGYLRGRLDSIDCLVRVYRTVFTLRVTPNRSGLIPKTNSPVVDFEGGLAVLLSDTGEETDTYYTVWLRLNPEVKSENMPVGKIRLRPYAPEFNLEKGL